MSTLTVESTRFGSFEISADTVIEFPAGLIGLGGSRFALVSADAEGAFHWLHSVEDPALALPVTNPWLFFSDFVVDLSDADTDRVAVGSARRLGDGPDRFRAGGLQCEPPRADLDCRRPRPSGDQRGVGRSGARRAVRRRLGRAGGLAARRRAPRAPSVRDRAIRTFPRRNNSAHHHPPRRRAHHGRRRHRRRDHGDRRQLGAGRHRRPALGARSTARRSTRRCATRTAPPRRPRSQLPRTSETAG